ncbi:MAG: hypothetical protein AAFU79_03450 [Myxococcota bacterium]
MAGSEPRPGHLVLVPFEDQRSSASFSAAEYLQLAAQTRRTVRVTVGSLGHVDVRAGDPWHAEDAEGSGPAAFERLMAAGGLDGSVAARCLDIAIEDLGAEGLDLSLDGALLEAARIMDETQGSAQRGRSRSQAAEEGFEALLDRDYEAAWRAFSAARALGDDREVIQMNLSRLEELGYAGD